MLIEIAVLAIIAAFLVSALPLHLAVKLLGGKTNLIKTAFVAFVSGIVFSSIKMFLGIYSRLAAGLFAFFVLIWIYREMFRLKWHKAVLAWILQFVFLGIFYLILVLATAAFIGISILL